MINTKRNFVLFVAFVVGSVILLVLSFLFDFFFFFPIFCILPFSCRRRRYFRDSQNHQADGQTQTQTQPHQEVREKQEESNSLKELKSNLKARFCPVCGGEIKEPNVNFCYFCGSRLPKV